jgi:diaminohydroxyphosphoribosylaminopyrimidine deaminase/5-amino-6-(5-phosphoribosylamino)uracil reductase
MLSDEQYMERALRLAERGVGRTAPNPVVGAVIVNAEGVVVGQGHHERAGGPHAELRALDMAGDRANGATLFCTLEPCSHTGRTGPCVEAILERGVRRVVAAIEDPNPLVSGAGVRFLRAHGVEVQLGVKGEAARSQNAPFLTRIARRRPFVLMKIALSVDGRIAAAPGVRTRLTSEAALRHVHRTRAMADAIGVGSGTILSDDPLLTVREVFRERPLLRVIFDRRLRTPPHARILTTLGAGPVLIVTSRQAMADKARTVDALRSAGAIVDEAGDGSLRDAIRSLALRDVNWLILEGGRAIHEAAWRERLVDRVQVLTAPVTLGPRAMPWLSDLEMSPASLSNVQTCALGPDILVEGDVHRAD